jgi:ABC-type lipoprotein export system ATPase subunit
MTNVTAAEYGADALIVCDNVVRIYQVEGIEVQALQGLDLLVDPGEMVAIIGASGSGKSTLLNVLSGLDAPTAGRARVGGWDLLSLTAADRLTYRRSVVGFIWQQTARNLLPYLSAAENVALPMAFAGERPRVRASRASELLGALGMGDKAARRPGELSGGEQQRVSIAVALANSPQVLFADEPTGELDAATGEDVFEALRSANTELGTTVVIVTHDAEVSGQVQRTVAIRDGRTSSEVFRRTEVDEHGASEIIAEEYAVLDRAGRLQLPSDYRSTLGLRDRVRLELEQDHVGIWPDARGAGGRGDGAAGRARHAGVPAAAAGLGAGADTVASAGAGAAASTSGTGAVAGADTPAPAGAAAPASGAPADQRHPSPPRAAKHSRESE